MTSPSLHCWHVPSWPETGQTPGASGRLSPALSCMSAVWPLTLHFHVLVYVTDALNISSYILSTSIQEFTYCSAFWCMLMEQINGCCCFLCFQYSCVRYTTVVQQCRHERQSVQKQALYEHESSLIMKRVFYPESSLFSSFGWLSSGTTTRRPSWSGWTRRTTQGSSPWRRAATWRECLRDSAEDSSRYSDHKHNVETQHDNTANKSNLRQGWMTHSKSACKKCFQTQG